MLSLLSLVLRPSLRCISVLHTRQIPSAYRSKKDRQLSPTGWAEPWQAPSCERRLSLAKQSFDAVIKNISERCTSGEILQSMEHCGFSTQNVTYIHLPSSTKGNLGYCFVGFKSSQVAKDFCESSEFQLHLRGKNKIIHVEPLGFSLPTRKVTETGWPPKISVTWWSWNLWTGETWRKKRVRHCNGGTLRLACRNFSRLSPQDYILTVPESRFGYG